jgi:hypothetical protein
MQLWSCKTIHGQYNSSNPGLKELGGRNAGVKLNLDRGQGELDRHRQPTGTSTKLLALFALLADASFEA